MSLCLQINDCIECGDRMIHQSNRQSWESSSAFGQHIFNDLPKDFFAADIDMAVYARTTGILRVIEHKPTGSGIRPSQRAILPMLAIALTSIPRASVWLVRSDWPFSAGLAAQVLPVQPFALGDAVPLHGEAWAAFQRARPVVPEGQVP